MLQFIQDFIAILDEATSKSKVKVYFGTIICQPSLISQPNSVVLGSYVSASLDRSSWILKDPWNAIQLTAHTSLFLLRSNSLADNRPLRSFKTGMVMASLGIFFCVEFSSFSFPLIIAESMSDLRFFGITPCFKWATLNPDKYWLIDAELTFLPTINQPTYVTTILSSMGKVILTPVSTSHLLM